MLSKTYTKEQLLIFWRVWVISLILFWLLVLWPKTGSSCTMSLFVVSWLNIYSPWNFIIFLICTEKRTITIMAVNSYLLMLEVWYFICVSSIRLSDMWLYICKLSLGWSLHPQCCFPNFMKLVNFITKTGRYEYFWLVPLLNKWPNWMIIFCAMNLSVLTLKLIFFIPVKSKKWNLSSWCVSSSIILQHEIP